MLYKKKVKMAEMEEHHLLFYLSGVGCECEVRTE
jgi:hypothetical protein